MDVIFSCCLYGNNERYIKPLFDNDFKKIEKYLAVSCQFYVYCNSDVKKSTIDRLRDYGYIVVECCFSDLKMGGMFIRYLPILHDLADAVCIRDTDCCYTEKELFLLKEWLNSKFDFHIIRGHELHIYPIMGGLFSIKGNAKSKFKTIFENNKTMTRSYEYNKDQIFLAKKIYPELVKFSLVHSVRVVYKTENYIHYKSGLDFIGETKVNDNKRTSEKYLHDKNILEIPFFISKYSTSKIIARVITIFSKSNYNEI